jgi:hypothetical protein
MGRYSSLLGTSIELVYRSFGVDLRTSGKLLSDSGTYIIIELSLDHEERLHVCRLKLPYDCIVRLNESYAETTSEFRCVGKGGGQMNSEPQSKSRRYPRVALPKGMHVGWQVKSERAISPVTTLGLGGLFVSIRKPPAVGEMVILILPLPEGDVRVKGVVRDSLPGRGMGVEFTGMSQGDRARLQQLLKRLLQ